MAIKTTSLRLRPIYKAASLPVVIGPDEIVIGSLKEEKSRDLILDTLEADTLRFSAGVNWRSEANTSQLESSDPYDLEDVDGEPLYAFDSPYSDVELGTVPYGSKVEVLRNGTVVATYYARKVEDRGDGSGAYDGEATNLIGLLIKGVRYMGGVWQQTDGKTVGDIVADIMGDLPYTIESDIASEPAVGFIPICDGREALRQLLFPYGAYALPMTNGSLHIAFADVQTVKSIPDGDIAVGGKALQSGQATRVNLTEHAYVADSSAAEQLLYDATTLATSFEVDFPEPMHSLRRVGLTINSSGANHAIVSGTGQLYGKPYRHTTRTISADTGNDSIESTIINITSATMVNALNALPTLQRLAAYHGAAKELDREIYIDDAAPEELTNAGRLTGMNGAKVTGYFKAMSTTYSGEMLSQTKIITGWKPEAGPTAFNRSELLTGSGTFTVPAGVTSLRVYIVQGGQSGEPGLKGAAGTAGNTRPLPQPSTGGARGGYDGTGGAGGEPGVGGLAGKVSIVDIAVTPGQEIAYNCGEGGVSKASGTTHVGVNEGGESTFGTYSSAQGSRLANGLVDPVTGDTYAVNGTASPYAGYQGGPFGTSGKGRTFSVTVGGVTYKSGTWPGELTDEVENANAVVGAYADGGNGGGPAVGGNGKNGVAATQPTADQTLRYAFGTAAGGKGGQGATGAKGADAPSLGSGGNGGNGGGGGGGGGWAQLYYSRVPGGGNFYGFDDTRVNLTGGAGGAGGNGGLGGTGGDGFVLALMHVAQ